LVPNLIYKMSYNPNPDPQNIRVISAGSTVTELNRFPVGIGSTGSVSLKYSNQPISYSNPLPVSLGSSNITITGDVNVGTTVSVTSSPDNPVHTHITEIGSSGILQDEGVPYLPVGVGTVNIGLDYLPVGISTLQNTVSVGNTVSISNTAFYVTNPVTTVSVTGIGSTVNVLGTVGIGTLGHVTLNLAGVPVSSSNPLPVGISTFNNIIVIKQSEGSLYSFNNHATNTNRGWTMDDTMRPVLSIRVNSSGTTIANLAEIAEYEIGNNNASQSTIIYEWYEGDINIAGAAIPAWTSLGTRMQYRVYQDKYSSNAGNTFTQNSSVMRHSGVIIGKNTSGDEGPSTMNGGASPNMLTLCMRRVDNSTKLDVWFAFTCKELS
jgi:hypothetical protein